MDRHVALFKFVGGSDKAVDEMEIKSFIENRPVGLIVSCQGPRGKQYGTGTNAVLQILRILFGLLFGYVYLPMVFS